MSAIEKMTEEEFIKDFGITPNKAKELIERLREIVNQEVHEVIEHADYYMNPTQYCDEDWLKERYGDDVLEKDEDSDGYPNLYDFGEQNSAVMTFMHFISWHTSHGGHTSAIRACDLMDLEFTRDK